MKQKQTLYENLTTEIELSPVDQRWHVTVNDKPMVGKGFATNDEARIFLMGYVAGFTAGVAEPKFEMPASKKGIT